MGLQNLSKTGYNSEGNLFGGGGRLRQEGVTVTVRVATAQQGLLFGFHWMDAFYLK